MAAETVIQVRDLVKQYGDFTALGGISFDVHHGEILGLLGPNGAGKSTTMKILTSFISANSGSVQVDGIDLFANPLAVRERLGYLPESTPLYDDMIVYDYLEYVGEMRGFSRTECKKRIADVTRTVGIADRVGSVIGTLSKGLRQRVGLAQALLHNPKILILDEPTGGLDPNQIVEIRKLIRELGKNHTIILSTHILPEVRQTCDRIVIVHKGKVVADCTADELEGKVGDRTHHLVVGVVRGAADSDAVAAVLAALPGVRTVTHQHASDHPTPHDTWEIVAERDMRAEVFQTATDQAWSLVELRRKHLDLEGIFQQLTQEG